MAHKSEADILLREALAKLYVCEERTPFTVDPVFLGRVEAYLKRPLYLCTKCQWHGENAIHRTFEQREWFNCPKCEYQCFKLK